MLFLCTIEKYINFLEYILYIRGEIERKQATAYINLSLYTYNLRIHVSSRKTTTTKT